MHNQYFVLIQIQFSPPK